MVKIIKIKIKNIRYIWTPGLCGILSKEKAD
jgi:hypothetical protein